MGYTLSVGQAYVDWSSDAVRVSTEPVASENAPGFGEYKGNTNFLDCSYGGWQRFCESLGIEKLMFRKNDNWEFTWNSKVMPVLIVEHPGCSPLVPAHLEFLRFCLDEYKTNHPDHIAAHPPLKDGVKKSNWNKPEDYVQDTRYDGDLCLAEWLVFWVDYTLKNCDKPVFVNS